MAVELRIKSSKYGKQIAVELSGDSRTKFYVPRGFAHGFGVLSETATFFYKCDNYYNKAAEGGIIYNDPELGIDWGLPQEQLLLSEKDTVLPTLKIIANELNF